MRSEPTPGLRHCINAKTGELVWDKRPTVPSGRTGSWSSAVRSGDRVYLVTKKSDTLVFRAGPTFELLAVNARGDGMTNSSLVASEGELFIHTHQHLWCIDSTK